MPAFTSIVCFVACVVLSTASPFVNFGQQGSGYGGDAEGDNSAGYGEYKQQQNGPAENKQPQQQNSQNGIPPEYLSQFIAVNGSSVWMYNPVNGSYPTYARNYGNNTNGETVTEFCQYVVQNKTLPFTLPSNYSYNSPGVFYDLPMVIQYCGQMLEEGGTFYMPVEVYNRPDFFG